MAWHLLERSSLPTGLETRVRCKGIWVAHSGEEGSCRGWRQNLRDQWVSVWKRLSIPGNQSTSQADTQVLDPASLPGREAGCISKGQNAVFWEGSDGVTTEQVKSICTPGQSWADNQNDFQRFLWLTRGFSSFGGPLSSSFLEVTPKMLKHGRRECLLWQLGERSQSRNLSLWLLPNPGCLPWINLHYVTSCRKPVNTWACQVLLLCRPDTNYLLDGHHDLSTRG